MIVIVFFAGDFLSIVSLVAMVLYFVTSSDSGSLVIDCLSANGHPDPPIFQRIFWALTEGATATALLVSGGDKALRALQTVSIAAGLPFTLVINFMCVSLWRALKIEAQDLDPNGPQFSIELFDPISRMKYLIRALIAIFLPWWFIGTGHGKVNRCSPWPTRIFLGVLFYVAILMCALEPVHDGLFYVGCTMYLFFVTFATSTRIAIRSEYGIVGNMLEDWFAFLVAYFMAAVQLDQHMEDMESEDYKKKNDLPRSSPEEQVSPPHQYSNSDFVQDACVPYGTNAYSNVAYITPEALSQSFNL